MNLRFELKTSQIFSFLFSESQNLAKDYWSSMFVLKFKEDSAMRSVDHELEQVNGWKHSLRTNSIHCPDDPFYQDHIPRDPPSHDGQGSYLQ
ncbi:hypothetical protein Hdeb2414_s0276g00854401 [Helianthus debilis subsp. tardiflorus]